MQSSPWSAGRTIALLGFLFILIVYALLGTSSKLSCQQTNSGTRNCTLTRYFLFENDPLGSWFEGNVIRWDDPMGGRNSYNITLATRDGQGTMPSIGGAGWQTFLKAQLDEFLQTPWQYVWQGVVYNRNILLTLVSMFGLFWGAYLFTTLRGDKLQ